ncbi:hypothetical protein F5888DRAFT_1803923 [Russula emetica]|nr:hypothetical protein F5888DRAFT_1803923 [Russula emetica]
MAALPLLLPTQPAKMTSSSAWEPKRHLQPPQPPIRKLQPSPRYVPYIRPSPPYIIDLLPPKAYPDNASKSLCTKFVHTSTNKIRCPVNAVTVRHIKSGFFTNQRVLSAAAKHTVALPLLNIEHKLSRMLLSHIQSAWFNPPRRRRFLAAVFVGLAGIISRLLRNAVLLRRLSIIREVLPSGFQLKLYVDDEKSFMYWELSHVAHEHLAYTQLARTANSRAYGELIFVRSYLNAFRSLCTGMFMLMLPELRQPASRLALKFVRRYKWAFRPEYARLCPQVVAPDLSAFASASAEVLKEEQEPLRLHFKRARDGLAELSRLAAGVAGPWHEDRLQANNPS